MLIRGNNMKIKTLKTFLNKFDESDDDIEIFVDTEAALFTCHLVDIAEIELIHGDQCKFLGKNPFIIINLDDSAKNQ